MTTNRLVTFYSPNLVLGGTEMVFARMGSLLASEGWRVQTLDMEMGSLRQLAKMRWHNSNILHFGSTEAGYGYLVTTPKYLSHLLNNQLPLPSKTRVLIYQVHPLEWVGAFYPGIFKALSAFGIKGSITWKHLLDLIHPKYQNQVRLAMHAWGAAGGGCFMDAPNLNMTIDMLGLPPELFPSNSLLPVVSETGILARTPRPLSDPMHLFYFGRISDFKTSIILTLLKDLHLWSQRGTSICLTLIGDGDGMAKVRALANSLATTRFKCVFLGLKSLAEAQAIMVKDADAVFAMGSSALDAGLAAIPTAIINPISTVAPMQPYLGWLHNQMGYALGSYEPSRYSTRTMNIAEICEDVALGTAPHEEIRTHILQQHGANNTIKKIITLLEGSSLQLESFSLHHRTLGLARKPRNIPCQPIMLETY